MVSGEGNPMYGKKHKEETIEKLRKINTENAMFGSDNPASRGVKGINLKTGEIVEFESANQAAKYFGLFNNSHIIECCRGKRPSCKGHK
jgi:hypothetical protein